MDAAVTSSIRPAPCQRVSQVSISGMPWSKADRAETSKRNLLQTSSRSCSKRSAAKELGREILKREQILGIEKTGGILTTRNRPNRTSLKQFHHGRNRSKTPGGERLRLFPHRVSRPHRCRKPSARRRR